MQILKYVRGSHLLTGLLLILLIISWGCNGSIITPYEPQIPEDPTHITVPTPETNNLKPIVKFRISTSSDSRIIMDFLGILQPPNISATFTLKANENFFIREDSVVKGMLITQKKRIVSPLDLVFVFDNAKEMRDEHPAILKTVKAYAAMLNRLYPMRYACVSYNDEGIRGTGQISGALNFSKLSDLNRYLNKRGSHLDKTKGFSGPNRTLLAQAAKQQAYQAAGKCAPMAVLFAQDLFKWTPDAIRIYIHFTDAFSEPGNTPRWRIAGFCQELHMNSTIHTVWSGSTALLQTQLPIENPLRMSECSNGDIETTTSTAEELTLKDFSLPDPNLYRYRIEYISANPQKPHDVTILLNEGENGGEVTYKNIRY